MTQENNQTQRNQYSTIFSCIVLGLFFFLYTLHQRRFCHIKISKIDDSAWYKEPKTPSVMESHFMATKLNHSITRLIIKTKRQREAQASECSEDSSVRAASWQLWGGVGGGGKECSEGQAHSQHARGIQRVPRTRAQRTSKPAWIG